MASVLESGGRQVTVERGVFAMPLVPDFSVTYLWLRELRRWHGERMVAAHLVAPSAEQVLVGRYNAAHDRVWHDAGRSSRQRRAGALISA